MPRFVILAHDWPEPHFDLLMRVGDTLRSWRLHADPSSGGPVPASPNADHRLHYLDYEGEVSNGRGVVRRIDAGEYAGELGAAFDVVWHGNTLGRARMVGGLFQITPSSPPPPRSAPAARTSPARPASPSAAA